MIQKPSAPAVRGSARLHDDHAKHNYSAVTLAGALPRKGAIPVSHDKYLLLFLF